VPGVFGLSRNRFREGEPAVGQILLAPITVDGIAHSASRSKSCSSSSIVNAAKTALTDASPGWSWRSDDHDRWVVRLCLPACQTEAHEEEAAASSAAESLKIIWEDLPCRPCVGIIAGGMFGSRHIVRESAELARL